MSQPESAVVNAALRWLWARGCYVWRANTGAYKPEGSTRYIRYGTPGCADILGVVGRGPHRGKILCCECKTDTGRLSEVQQVFLDHIKESGGLAFVVRTSNYSAVIDAELGIEE